LKERERKKNIHDFSAHHFYFTIFVILFDAWREKIHEEFLLLENFS